MGKLVMMFKTEEDGEAEGKEQAMMASRLMKAISKLFGEKDVEKATGTTALLGLAWIAITDGSDDLGYCSRVWKDTTDEFLAMQAFNELAEGKDKLVKQ